MIASAAALFWYTGAFQALSSMKLSVSLTDPDPPELPPMHREAPRQQLMAAHTGRAVRPRPRTLQVLRDASNLTLGETDFCVDTHVTLHTGNPTGD